MQITFLVNDATDIQPSQTTAMLISTAINQGHRVGITGVGDLSYQSEEKPCARTRWIAEQGLSLSTLVITIAKTIAVEAPLTESNLLFIRTNPARDGARGAMHGFALNLAQCCEDSGVRVVNRPQGLLQAASKSYLLDLPGFTYPQSLVSQHPEQIREFIRKLGGPAVLKPIQGTRGSDVFLISHSQDSNLNSIIDVILRQGPAMVQRCIPGAEAGDTRVVVLNGDVLTLKGKPAAIQRVPKAGDFRSNIHAGGMAQPGKVTDAMHKVVAAIGPKLVRDGLFLVGLDFIDAQLVEINVFSTGGLRDAEKFTHEPFAAAVMSILSQSV
ncbi:MAG: hypothetical protein WA885_12165 [Phormidesmis sp.]